MKKIEFLREEKEQLAGKLQDYLLHELDVELGQFDAEFLFDFIAENMGLYFYNKGLQDAQLVVSKKLDEITDVLDEIAI